MGKTGEPLHVVLNVTGWVTPSMVRLPARVLPEPALGDRGGLEDHLGVVGDVQEVGRACARRASCSRC